MASADRLKNVPTGYRLHGLYCTVLHLVSLPSLSLPVVNGAGRQQVSTRRWLQLTSYRVDRPGVQPLLYSASPKTATESTYLVHSTLGQVDRKLLQEIASTDRLQSLPTGCWLHSPHGTGCSPKPVTEPTDLVL